MVWFDPVTELSASPPPPCLSRFASCDPLPIRCGVDGNGQTQPSSSSPPTAQSISSVDMNYDIGTRPNQEAGPIERVVLQEGSGEHSSDESESDRSGRTTSTSDVAPPPAALEDAEDGHGHAPDGIIAADCSVEVDVSRSTLREVSSDGRLEGKVDGQGYAAAEGHAERGAWGSPPGRVRAPRLSVDLINVDPFGEAVKNVRTPLL